MLLALAMLAGVSAGNSGDSNATLTGAYTTTATTVTNSATLTSGADSSQATTAITTDTTEATNQTQQIGIVDARYAVQQAGPAVVTVINTMQVTTRGRFGPATQTAEASGSGIIIDEAGYIVTNQHVVENQTALEVIFSDGTRAPATLVGEDASIDLAVIKVNVAVPAVAKLGDSNALEPGQPVIAIGTALGDFQNTVTAGIISGLHRQLDDTTLVAQDLIQTDAAINHGNSGGPLLDLEGNVIGINTAVVRADDSVGDIAEGLGFAIPSNTVKTVVERLIGSN
jgi:2-alkenal reductase